MERYCGWESFEGVYADDEFWNAYEEYTKTTVDDRGNFFSCSCFGDFVLQSDWMAKGKSTSLYPLLCHVLTYTLVFLVGITAVGLSPAYVLVNGLIHFGVDFFTSKLNSYASKNWSNHNFWICVSVDQSIHYSTIILTYPLLYWYFVI